MMTKNTTVQIGTKLTTVEFSTAIGIVCRTFRRRKKVKIRLNSNETLSPSKSAQRQSKQSNHKASKVTLLTCIIFANKFNIDSKA